MSMDRSRRASALAKYSQWPFLRLTRKSSTGSRLAIDHVHLEGVAELAGIAEVSSRAPWPGPRSPRRPSPLDVLDQRQRDLPEPRLEVLGHGPQRLAARLRTGPSSLVLGSVEVGIGEDLVVVAAPGLRAEDRAVDRDSGKGEASAPAESSRIGRRPNRVGESLGSSLMIWRITLRLTRAVVAEGLHADDRLERPLLLPPPAAALVMDQGRRPARAARRPGGPALRSSSANSTLMTTLSFSRISPS